MTDLVVPHTGEHIEDIEALSLAGLAELLDDARGLESQMREFKQTISARVHEIMDHEREWTLRDGPWTLEGRSDKLVPTWDVDGLMLELMSLAAEGLISVSAADKAVVTKTDHKVSARGVDALLSSPKLSARLKAHRTMAEPENRAVTVKRADS